VQIAGPLTLRWSLRLSDGAPLSASPNGNAVETQIVRLVLARALALARKVKDAGATPVVFLDEPGLYAYDRRDPRHVVALQELRVLVLALRHEGALVGVHCCGNTDWGALLGLGFDIVSLDARLSLTPLLATGTFARFHEEGGILALGIVPTDFTATDDVGELCDLARVLLPEQPLKRAMLTPACGLALRTVQDAEHIFDELRVAQRRLSG
jgi:methionine synthase II (cobalamin-independent)